MKKISAIFILLYLPVIYCTAQVDPIALSILDSFSTKALEAPAVSMDFVITIHDEVEDSRSESSGSAVIKKDKYRIEMPDNITWFDGEAVYTLVSDVNEVSISDPDTDDNSFLSKPSLLFTMYRQDYKIRLVEKTGSWSVIDLYPEDVSADFSRIRIKIGNDYIPLSAEYKRKDGISLLLSISSFGLKKDYRDNFFTFDAKKHGDAEIIDMRF